MIVSFALALVLFLIVGVMGQRALQQVGSQFKELNADNVQGQVQLASIERAVWELRFGIANFMTADDAGRAKILADQDKWYKQVADSADAYAKGDRTPAELEAFKAWQDAYSKYVAARPRWFELYSAGQTQEAAQWRADQTNKYGAENVTKLANLIALQQKAAADREAAVTTMVTRTTLIYDGVMVAAIVFCVLLGLSITQAIAAPVRTLQAAFARLAGGDLRVSELKIRSKDEFGELAQAFSGAARQMRTLLQDIAGAASDITGQVVTLSEGAGQTAAAAEQVSRTMEDMAGGAATQGRGSSDAAEAAAALRREMEGVSRSTDEQARQVGETAQAVERLSVAMEGLTQTAARIRGVIERNGQAAGVGLTVVDKTVEGMSRIEAAVGEVVQRLSELADSSGRIGQITTAITEIADQTNLLALNAAIEAARAGEHGRGFAVVADEVRKLAERSAASAGEISQLVASIQSGTDKLVQAMEHSSEEVKVGADLASQAGRALQEVVGSAGEAATATEELVRGASSISSSGATINETIQAIAGMVQQNTAATERMAVSADTVAAAVASVAHVAEGNAAATQEVSASAEEMTASIEEIVAAAEALRGVVDRLQGGVSRFQL